MIREEEDDDNGSDYNHDTNYKTKNREIRRITSSHLQRKRGYENAGRTNMRILFLFYNCLIYCCCCCSAGTTSRSKTWMTIMNSKRSKQHKHNQRQKYNYNDDFTGSSETAIHTLHSLFSSNEKNMLKGYQQKHKLLLSNKKKYQQQERIDNFYETHDNKQQGQYHVSSRLLFLNPFFYKQRLQKKRLESQQQNQKFIRNYHQKIMFHLSGGGGGGGGIGSDDGNDDNDDQNHDNDEQQNENQNRKEEEGETAANVEDNNDTVYEKQDEKNVKTHDLKQVKNVLDETLKKEKENEGKNSNGEDISFASAGDDRDTSSPSLSSSSSSEKEEEQEDSDNRTAMMEEEEIDDNDSSDGAKSINEEEEEENEQVEERIVQEFQLKEEKNNDDQNADHDESFEQEEVEQEQEEDQLLTEAIQNILSFSSHFQNQLKYQQQLSKQLQKHASSSSSSSSTSTTTLLSNNDKIQTYLILQNTITQRIIQYMQDLFYTSSSTSSSIIIKKNKKHHPKSILHIITPKIPCIQKSPNYHLRIRSATALDSSLSIFVLECMTYICELYSSLLKRRALLFAALEEEKEKWKKDGTNHNNGIFAVAAQEVISDRRFEQLIECVLCALDVQKSQKVITKDERKTAAKNKDEEDEMNDASLKKESNNNDNGNEVGVDLPTTTNATTTSTDSVSEIETTEEIDKERNETLDNKILDNDDDDDEEEFLPATEEEIEEQEKHFSNLLYILQKGLSSSDAARAAWSMAVLGCTHPPSSSSSSSSSTSSSDDEKIKDKDDENEENRKEMEGKEMTKEKEDEGSTTTAGETIQDIVYSLLLRSINVLKVRLECLQQEGFVIEENKGGEMVGNDDDMQSTEFENKADERIDDKKKEEEMEHIAKDAAYAIWSFACVKACSTEKITSVLPYNNLLDVGCSILCQSKENLLRIAREKRRYDMDDIVDRLAQSSSSFSDAMEDIDSDTQEKRAKQERDSIKHKEEDIVKDNEVGSLPEVDNTVIEGGDDDSSMYENITNTNHTVDDGNELNSTATTVTEATSIESDGDKGIAQHQNINNGGGETTEQNRETKKPTTEKAVHRTESQCNRESLLIDFLTAKELTSIVWSVALNHDQEEEREEPKKGESGKDLFSSSSTPLQSKVKSLTRESFYRISGLLQEDLNRLQREEHRRMSTSTKDNDGNEKEQLMTGEELDETTQQLEVVDAATLLTVAATVATDCDDASSSIDDLVSVKTEVIVAKSSDDVTLIDAKEEGNAHSVDGQHEITVQSKSGDDGHALSKQQQEDSLVDETVSVSSSEEENIEKSMMEQKKEIMQDEATGEVLEVIDAAAILAMESETFDQPHDDNQSDANAADDDTIVGDDQLEMENDDEKAPITPQGEEESEYREAGEAEVDEVGGKANRVVETSGVESEGQISVDMINTTAENVTREGADSAAVAEELSPSNLNHDQIDENGMIGGEDIVSFSVCDLSTIAWAMTELQYPDRYKIMNQITAILVLLGRTSLKEMKGGDLSNLAWAIAKNAYGMIEEAQNSDAASSNMDALIRWIGYWSLSILEKDISTEGEEDESAWWDERKAPNWASDAICHFQPPQLSRLMWSLASVVSLIRARGGNDYDGETTFSQLSRYATEVAGSELSMFSPEDLGRIIWAFTELCDFADESNYRTHGSNTIGRILSTIESSLLQWESGPKHSQDTKKSHEKLHESMRFTPFFGKSRLLLSMLDQNVGTTDADTDEESGQYPSQTEQSLPLLRDLTIDPATLCKMSYGFSRVSANYPRMRGQSVLLGIATRLFAAKNGRLLKECENQDIIRLCYACAQTILTAGNEISVEDRDFILRHLPRRVVQLLNDSIMTKKDGKKSSRLDQLLPSELAVLFWSLGELGVHCSRDDDNPRLAHRKMHLLPPKPVLSIEELGTISVSSTVDLFCGIMKLGKPDDDYILLITILLDLTNKVPLLGPEDLFRVTASIVKLKRFVEETYQPENDNQPLSTSAKNSDGGKDMFEAKDGEESNIETKNMSEEKVENIVTEFEKEEAAADVVIDSLDPTESRKDQAKQIIFQSNNLLTIIAEEAARKISEFTVQDIHRLLQLYVLTPIQADEVVGSIDEEVNKRITALELAASTYSGSVQDLVRHAADSSVEAASNLNNLSSGGEKLSASFMKGMKALFDKQGNTEEGKNKDDAALSLEDVARQVNRAAASSCKAAARLERVGKGALINAEKTLRGVEESAAFELGRCQELISAYRRLEFQTGTRKTRYDEARRRDIGKRILSRLFQ